MNTPVSFEIAKLLKEKGIIFETEIYYSSVTKVTSVSYAEIAAPTIAEVVMRLYEKHGIWISVIDVSPSHILWEYQISKKETDLIHSSGQYPPQYNYSPTEAYEAGIVYTLNNLM